jgi:hypothetical protein
MLPLIDGDILLYECGFGAETGWKAIYPDSPDPPSWEYVAEMVDSRIEEICKAVKATEKPRLFITGKDNFREKIAKKAIYKGQRDKLAKPWHYNNIKAYLIGCYDAEVVDGMEADDKMCIIQTNNLNLDKKVEDAYNYPFTIICTRDKDLRQCPGWHFGWELGSQPQFGPKLVDEIGEIHLSSDNKKITGWGLKFFYSQLITGDRVDNIPGLPRKGPVEAFKLLANTTTHEEMEKAVVAAYKVFYGDVWREELLEQGQLLWMVRELDKDGNPVMWNIKYG